MTELIFGFVLMSLLAMKTSVYELETFLLLQEYLLRSNWHPNCLLSCYVPT